MNGTVYVDHKPPKRGSKMQSVQNLNNATTSKWYEIGSQLLLINNWKFHMVFRVVPTSVTLYDLEWHNSPHFALFNQIR